MSKDTQQTPATYSVRLPAEMRRRLESASQAGGRSLHAEILIRLETSLNPSKLDWRKIIDPAVCAALEDEASTWNMTFEEALSRKLQEHLDPLLECLFLEDLSSEAMARKITVGQVLDDRLVKTNKKHQESPLTPQPFYPFSDLNKIKSHESRKAETRKVFEQIANARNAERIAIETSFVRQIVHQELAKAGITLPPDDESEKEKGEGEA